jgi:hypothetical protein
MSVNLKVPYFDRRKSYNAEERFAKDPMQKLLALFLSQPENYSDLASVDPEDREDVFFYKFGKFADNYINLTLDKHFDTVCYFRSLSVDRPGAVNVCGGGGKLAGSSKKYFKDRYKRGQENTKIMSSYLADKYKVLPHTRTFLGHTEIWKNPGPHLLELEGWQWVKNQCYSEPDFKTPFPERLDSDLVPLEIRNKTIQKWKNARRSQVSTTEQEADDEEEKAAPEVRAPTPPTIQITPEMQALMDEDW